MVRDLAALIDALHPVVLITLDPDHGMYGHPEHMAVARAVTEIAAEKNLQVYAAENRSSKRLSSGRCPVATMPHRSSQTFESTRTTASRNDAIVAFCASASG